MLAGIYAPTAGEIRFDGAVVNEVEARDRNVGIVFQSYALYPNMAARDNIRFPLKFKRLTREEADARVQKMAALVQVVDLLDRKPSEMSGGQQQRIALARALVKEPQLLLLDEPLSNLDATLRLTMRGEIRRLQRSLGVTTILVTHDQIEATTMADRIICMSKGRIEQIGTADSLYHRPDSLFVAGFIGSPPINLLEGEAAGATLRVGEVSLPLDKEASGRVTLGVRPESVRLGERGFAARIEDLEPHGRETIYHLADAARAAPGARSRFGGALPRRRSGQGRDRADAALRRRRPPHRRDDGDARRMSLQPATPQVAQAAAKAKRPALSPRRISPPASPPARRSRWTSS